MSNTTKKAAPFWVLHTYGDVEPEIIAGPLPTRAAAVKATRDFLRKRPDNCDPEGGFYIITGHQVDVDCFSGSEIEDARDAAQEEANAE